MVGGQILNVSRNHPLNKLSDPLKQRIIAAQSNSFETEFEDAATLCARAFSDLKIAISPPIELRGRPSTELGDRSARDLLVFFSALLAKNGIPAQAIPLHAANLSHRVQLLRAYDEPDEVIRVTCEKILRVVGSFPTAAEHITCGRNPGDVLDPYILAAAQVLMCEGDFEHTISATVAHKVLMIIEGLLGHLHEDVIGAMRGNVRVPEPRGDGRRLGIQLMELQNLYGGEAFYDALRNARKITSGFLQFLHWRGHASTAETPKLFFISY